MVKFSRKQILCSVTAVIIVFSVLLFAGISVVHSDSCECSEDCPVCVFLRDMNENKLVLPAISAFFTFLSVLFLYLIRSNPSCERNADTPISMKVRLAE